MKNFLLVFAFLCIAGCVYSQGVLKGVVKDLQNNQTIPGATVKINGTSTSTATDDDGAFSLEYTGDFKSLNVKAIGYSAQDIPVTDKTKELVIALEPTNLSTGEIQVEGNKKKNLETPQSIGFLSKEDINRDIGLNIQNTMNLIPGVKMQFRNLGSGVLLAIRGYGLETRFNGNGYKAYYNDIPLTDADGTTALDEVDYTNLSSVEVYKGPTSSIYGTGIAGVLNMRTSKAPWGTNLVVGALGGSFGLFRTNTGLSIGNEKLSMFVNYGHQQATGFREHNKTSEDFALVNGSVFWDSKNTLSFFGNYSNVYNALAGELDSLTFFNNPEEADTNYIKNDAHIKTESSRIGFSFDHMFSKTFSNHTTFYAGFFMLDQPSAAGLSRANRTKVGARTTFNFAPTIGKIKTRFSFGGEFLQNLNFAQSYALANNVQGSLRGDQEIKPLAYNVFAQADVNITKTTLLTAGASVNFTEYTVLDMIPQSNTHVNASGYRRFDPVISPRVAINQLINNNVSVYASFSMGFAPPSTSQILITQLGRVNLDLKPENATSIEIGTKGNLMQNALNYELAAYQMDVKDKLVTQNFAAANGDPAYSITTNAGKVRYRGVEAKINYSFIPKKSNILTLIRPFVTYTFTDNKNVDFKNNNNNDSTTIDYTDKVVPGIAPHVINAGLDVETKPGVYVNLTYSYTDKIFLTFDNSRVAKAYGLLNSRVGIRRNIAGKFNIDLYGGADNMTGQLYPTELFLNVNDRRFYISGPNKINFYGGLSLQYLFNK